MAVYAGGILFVFLLRMIGVAIGTVRILLTNRGNELWSGTLGFFEVLVYVIGIGVVVQDLTDIPMLLSYCFGFSVGTVVGIRIEQRMAMGYVNLRAISRAQSAQIANALRDAGFGATLSHGEGRDGSVGIITATVSRKHSRRAMQLVHQLDPDAFMVADEARAVARGWLPSAATIFPTATAGVQRTVPAPSPSQPLPDLAPDEETEADVEAQRAESNAPA
jgi:uncharacterized protein YebE (UPF0316 family)